MLYAVVTWRASKGGPTRWPARAHAATARIESTWILVTTVIVLFLAGFGTYELVQPEGAGGGQGPTPLWTPRRRACCRSR